LILLMPGAEECVDLPERTYQVWHGFFPDLRPGQLYGFRVHGPYEPKAGHRFNPHKLLLDPYAKAIGRDLTWDDRLFGYSVGHADTDLSFDERDSAAVAPLPPLSIRVTWGAHQRCAFRGSSAIRSSHQGLYR
jgi:glycogen operon protein